LRWSALNPLFHELFSETKKLKVYTARWSTELGDGYSRYIDREDFSKVIIGGWIPLNYEIFAEEDKDKLIQKIKEQIQRYIDGKLLYAPLKGTTPMWKEVLKLLQNF